MDQDNKVFCPRCGSEMNTNSRYCMKCGYLNPEDPANKGMNKFISNNSSGPYQVGSGKTIVQNPTITTSLSGNTGNIKLCFIVNYLLYIGIIVLSFFLILGNSIIDFNTVKNSLFPYAIFVTSVVFLYVYSMELIFIKGNKKWWYSLIPFFSLFVLTDIVYRKKWLGILLLIPIVGQIFFIVVLYKLGTKFQYNGVLTALFPIIYIPKMGFGSRLYEGVNYIPSGKTLEKDYKRKKIFFISLMVFLILGGIFIFWNNIIGVKNNTIEIKNYYYVYASKQLVTKTSQLASHNYLECNDYKYDDQNGVYYVWFADISEAIFLPFHSSRDVISGYVVIDNSNGNTKYYVSMSDGSYGFPETLSDDVNVKTVVSYVKLKERTDLNFCVSTKHR